MQSAIHLKPCSPLQTGLFIAAVLLHAPTKGYGSMICLILVLLVMARQLFLQTQLKKDVQAMLDAQAAFAHSQNPLHLQTLLAIIERLLQENKLLNDASREVLLNWHEQTLAQIAEISGER